MFDAIGSLFKEDIDRELSNDIRYHKLYIKYYNMIDQHKNKDKTIKLLNTKIKNKIEDYNILYDNFDLLNNKYNELLVKYNDLYKQKKEDIIAFNIDEKFINITTDDLSD